VRIRREAPELTCACVSRRALRGPRRCRRRARRTQTAWRALRRAWRRWAPRRRARARCWRRCRVRGVPLHPRIALGGGVAGGHPGGRQGRGGELERDAGRAAGRGARPCRAQRVLAELCDVARQARRGGHGAVMLAELAAAVSDGLCLLHSGPPRAPARPPSMPYTQSVPGLNRQANQKLHREMLCRC